MTIEELQQAFDRYGGNLARWPAAERKAAAMLIASDPEAERQAAAAARLDALLAKSVEALPADAGFLGRVLSATKGGTRRDTAIRATPRLAAWAGVAMIALLVAGYTAGMVLPQVDGEDAIAGLMFGDPLVITDTDSGSVL